tara:strand:+ start:2187 stop:3140 length:954 start_codon:yes stop_codon:yes gene_type:complete
MKSTTTKNNFFGSLIGQGRVKSLLSFYLAAQNRGQAMPNLLFLGAKGHGKTEFAIQTAKNILEAEREGQERSPVSCIMANCTEYSTPNQFVEDVIADIQGEATTIFLDECHALHKDIQNMLLSVLNPSKQHIRELQWKGHAYEIDNRIHTFVFATTEGDKMLEPLKERLTKVTFEPYKVEEIMEVILNASEDEFEMKCSKTLESVAAICRKSPRLAVSIASDMARAAIDGTFCADSWEILKEAKGIRPLGLDALEWQYLEILDKVPSAQLQYMAGKLQMTSSSVQKSVERFLLAADLIHIDGKRSTTNAAKALLAQA